MSDRFEIRYDGSKTTRLPAPILTNSIGADLTEYLEVGFPLAMLSDVSKNPTEIIGKDVPIRLSFNLQDAQGKAQDVPPFLCMMINRITAGFYGRFTVAVYGQYTTYSVPGSTIPVSYGFVAYKIDSAELLEY